MANACISRRAVLRATIPTIAGAAALPNVARAASEPPLVALLREWRRAYDAASAEGAVGSEVGPLMRYLLSLDKQAMSMPAADTRELAAKILIMSDYGENDIEDERLEALLADAERIVGIPMPATLAAFRAKLATAREAAI